MTTIEVVDWIADIFEEPVENIKPEITAEEIPAWDSLGVLNLIAALGEDFGIQLTDEELIELKTVSDIINLLVQHGYVEN